MVWRSLAILAEAGTTTEQTVSRVHRPKLAGAGIRGWTWHQVEIVPERLVRPSEPQGGSHASPRWHVRRGHWRQLARRAAGLRARLRGGRSRTRRGDQGLHHRGTARHDRLHPVAGAGRGHPRDQGLVREPHHRPAGVPDVRLCRLRKEHGAALRPRRARPVAAPGRARRRLRARRRHRDLHRQGGLRAEEQGHAGAHHPQPDLQRARGDRGGGRGRGEEGARGGDRHPHPDRASSAPPPRPASRRCARRSRR